MNQPGKPESDQRVDTGKPQLDSSPVSRRRFVVNSARYAAALGVLGVGLTGCGGGNGDEPEGTCLLYNSPSPRDRTRTRIAAFG